MHMHHRAARFGTLLPLLAILVGCAEDEQSLMTPRARPSAVAVPAPGEPRKPRSGERDFLEVSRSVPGYGGHFISSRGVLTAWVGDSANFGLARAALKARVAQGSIMTSGGRASFEVEIRKGDFSYQQLSDWRDIVSDEVLGAVDGVVTSDLDEEHNRVTIGVVPGKEGQARQAALQVLAKHDIPMNALRIIPQEPLEKSTAAPPKAMAEPLTTRALMLTPATLGSCCDVVAAGMRIGWTNAAGVIQGGCTVGFTTDMGANGTGFLTASHCSYVFWNNDTTKYYQGYVGYAGMEMWDRPSSPCTWPCGVSRYSDANLSKKAQTTSLYVGRILRPSNRVYASSTDTTVNQTKPHLYVAGSGANMVVGATIDFVGASSGWVYGNILQTCTDYYDNFPVSSGNRTQCSYKTDMQSRNGDSGGPVFFYDGIDGVSAQGIMFARSGSSDSWFSGWAHTYEDNTSGPTVTSFNVTAGITMSGSVSLSGAFSGGNPQISWSGVSVSGTTNPTTYYITRQTWNATSGTYIDNGILTTTSSTSFTDTGPYISTDTYLGSTYPGTCDYSWIAYQVKAYNSGQHVDSGWIYFRGAFNPDGCNG